MDPIGNPGAEAVDVSTLSRAQAIDRLRFVGPQPVAETLEVENLVEETQAKIDPDAVEDGVAQKPSQATPTTSSNVQSPGAPARWTTPKGSDRNTMSVPWKRKTVKRLTQGNRLPQYSRMAR